MFELSAAAGETTVSGSAPARILPAKATTTLRSGVKGKDAKRYWTSLKRELADAKSVTCVAHAASATVSRARAKSACARLGKLGIKAKLSTATARSAAGHVELKITY
jgi:hypothetical protein